MRLLALLQFQDEMRYLPGYFANVASQVDGIVALDHGSIDGSDEFVRRQPMLLALLQRPRKAPFNDGLFHRLLIEAGRRHGADWLLGLDADERLEASFRERVRLRIARDRGHGHSAYALPWRELWERPDTYRVDGIWGRKAKVALFEARGEHRFDARPFHAQWASLSGAPPGRHPELDANIYHLRMLRKEDRVARRARYRRLDPDNRWQRIGYDYLTDETGLILERIPPGRAYEPLGV
jgi:hypothetical protein